MKKTLLLVEVCGIQDYVFSSNHLAQNLGASALVEQVCGPWLESALKELKLTSNFVWETANGAQYQTLSRPHWNAEIINTGSGNAALLLENQNLARQIVALLSKKVINKARGLRLAAIHQEFDWEQDVFSSIHQQARAALARQKDMDYWNLPTPGVSVTAKCAYTGQPAVGWHNDPEVVGEDAAKRIRNRGETPRRISREVAHKISAETAGRNRLHALFPAVKEDFGMEFVYDFDDFGVSGESSYLAVIHIDGNRMGDRFKSLQVRFPLAKDNREYVNQVRNLSTSIQLKARVAMRRTVEKLFASLNNNKFGNVVPIPTQQNKTPMLPFRPLIFGGDDATFVCEGRLGLSLAGFYVNELGFGKVGEKDITLLESTVLGENIKFIHDGMLSDGKPLYARAGVAVVKNHYPFSRAYDLSIQLCASARKSIDSLIVSNEKDVCTLDWHIARSGAILPLGDLRIMNTLPQRATAC